MHVCHDVGRGTCTVCAYLRLGTFIISKNTAAAVKARKAQAEAGPSDVPACCWRGEAQVSCFPMTICSWVAIRSSYGVSRGVRKIIALAGDLIK